MMKSISLPAVAIAAALASPCALADAGHGASIGAPGDAKRVTRTVEITASDDMRFHPAKIAVKRGETVRLVVRNAGKIDHELVLGSPKDLKAHAALMRKFPGMEHDEPNQVKVGPGETREIVWRFPRSGTVDFACLIAGHFEAGMKGKIKIAAP